MDNQNRLAAFFFAYQQFASLVDLDNYALTKNQHRIIFIVSAVPTVNIKKIMTMLNISKQAAIKAVQELVDRNIIEERMSTKDKRVKILSLTASGAQFKQRVDKEQLAVLNHYFNGADDNWDVVIRQLASDYMKKM